RFGRQVFLEMRIGMKGHRALAILLAADQKLALQDVPDLGEIVTMTRMKRAGVVTNEACVGLGRSLGSRMKHHLARLSGKPECLPLHLVGMSILGRMVGALAH